MAKLGILFSLVMTILSFSAHAEIRLTTVVPLGKSVSASDELEDQLLDQRTLEITTDDYYDRLKVEGTVPKSHKRVACGIPYSALKAMNMDTLSFGRALKKNEINLRLECEFYESSSSRELGLYYTLAKRLTVAFK